jgi:predicted TIM-barrel fold metal-dependent hydrolase
MIHGQVFERHPDLKLVITEQYEGWWTTTKAELDAIYLRFGLRGRPRLPKLPGEYMRTNVFLGASFPSTFLAEEAYRDGYAANVLWGRDYPHVEGTFHVAIDGTGETVTRQALRHVLSRIPAPEARMIAGENAVRALGLDGDALAAVAARIGAPTSAELTTPLDAVPEVRPESNAFRGQAGPRPLDVPVA